jgi:hypothetical protein
LPGVEISTTEGHLLGIWEEGTDSSVIDDVLVVLGIKTSEGAAVMLRCIVY